MTILGRYWPLATVNLSSEGLWVHCNRDDPVAHMLPANIISWSSLHVGMLCVGEYIHFTFWTFVCVNRDLCWTLMKVKIDFTFWARCVFLDIGLRHSSIKLHGVALMHAVVQIIPRWLELRWSETSFIDVLLESQVLTFNCSRNRRS